MRQLQRSDRVKGNESIRSLQDLPGCGEGAEEVQEKPFAGDAI